MPVAGLVSAVSHFDSVASPMEELSLLVDSVVVKQVVLAEFKGGIMGYWPPELDQEVEFISNRVYLPHLPLTVVIISSGILKYKYVILLLGERFLLLALDRRVNAEDVGNRILNILRGLYSAERV